MRRERGSACAQFAAAIAAIVGSSLLGGCASSRVGTPVESQRPEAEDTTTAGFAPDVALRLIGVRRLSHRLEFGGTVVGGLSGIDYDPHADLWVMISDDRSHFAPTRFYTARLRYDADRFADVGLLSVVTLLTPDGRPYPARAADAEAIRFDPVTRSIWWTSEGERSESDPPIQPFVRQADLTGDWLASLPIAPMFRIERNGFGPRDNLVFEGLTLAPDARSLWVAMEAPLIEDGPLPDATRGAWSRFSRHGRERDGGFGPPDAQFAYRIGPIPVEGAWHPSFGQNGVSEILALDALRFLVLERAFVLGPAWRAKLYEADADAATDVRAFASLVGGEKVTPQFVPMRKTLVLDFASLGIAIDNLEGFAFGPVLANGHRSLVFVSDDNFNPGQVTQFIAFEVIPRTLEPRP